MAVTRVRYSPEPQQQKLRYQGVLIGCTDTAFAMGVDAATLGAVRVTEGLVRNLSDEPMSNLDPKSPGLNLAQIDKVATRLRVEFNNHTGSPWSALEEELDNNAAVVAQLWYSDIGGGDIGHAVYLQRVRKGMVRGVDPVKGTYQWFPEGDVIAAMRHFAAKTNLATGLRWGALRRAPWIHTNQNPQYED